MQQSALLARILREFRNHPGIVLTSSQVMARWSLDRQAASAALTTLTDEGFLTCVDDLYFWVDAPVPYFKGPPIAPRTKVLPFRTAPG